MSGEINYLEEVNQRLEQYEGVNSLSHLSTAAIQFAEMSNGARVRYALYGDLRDARSIVFITPSYTIGLDHQTEHLRLSTCQAILGSDYCVVGVETYHPNNEQLDHTERKKIATGSFVPLAKRLIETIDKVGVSEGQEITIFGYSMGSDVAVETAYQAMTNESHGTVKIDRLGAIECVRSVQRSELRLLMAFSKSGKYLLDSIIDSSYPALLEAHGMDLGIDLSEPYGPGSRRSFDRAVSRYVVNYCLSDPSGNLALFRGFANDNSKKQLNYLAGPSPDSPLTVVGRMQDSHICPATFFDGLDQGISKFTEPGDHTAGDNIRRHTGFVLQTVSERLNR